MVASTVVTGYCMKCKATREMTKTTSSTMSNGKPCLKGVCAVCGTKMNKIVASK
jgi:hypothetical protein